MCVHAFALPVTTRPSFNRWKYLWSAFNLRFTVRNARHLLSLTFTGRKTGFNCEILWRRKPSDSIEFQVEISATRMETMNDGRTVFDYFSCFTTNGSREGGKVVPFPSVSRQRRLACTRKSDKSLRGSGFRLEWRKNFGRRRLPLPSRVRAIVAMKFRGSNDTNSHVSSYFISTS